jgi:hypothetical protein
MAGRKSTKLTRINFSQVEDNLKYLCYYITTSERLYGPGGFCNHLMKSSILLLRNY